MDDEIFSNINGYNKLKNDSCLKFFTEENFIHISKFNDPDFFLYLKKEEIKNNNHIEPDKPDKPNKPDINYNTKPSDTYTLSHSQNKFTHVNTIAENKPNSNDTILNNKKFKNWYSCNYYIINKIFKKFINVYYSRNIYFNKNEDFIYKNFVILLFNKKFK